MENNTRSDTPPPYISEHDEFNYNWDNKSTKTLVQQSEVTDANIPFTPSVPELQVQTRTKSCRSGFDYPAELTQYGISEEDWINFTQAIRDEAKLSRRQWSTVVGKTIGTLAIGGIIVGFFGAVPAAIVARTSQRRQEKRNLAAALAGNDDTPLARHIARWNETFFRPHGVLIRVEVPEGYLGVLLDRDLHRDEYGPIAAYKNRDSNSLKARIVIMVLEGSVESSPRASSATGGE
ncbi:hypothetical protein N7495_010047 [Penicillium taxi]|uniref:uncharacterized protein n=1 Tax=Penicillium taxi TaxID=168475 RepID=UPI00254526D5|nr:uncharacterized protein N7495_010047 [Penicillium taxi]KAJ5885537.1 hypothetical protein N7495_010047 [Penicillium taxi]